jgi:hypothetical protein
MVISARSRSRMVNRVARRPLADERVGDVERVEHLKRSGMDDGGP